MGSLLYLPTPTFTLTFFLPGKKFFSKTRKNPCILEKEPVILFSKGDTTVSREKGGNTMTKADLVEKIAKEAGITKRAAEKALKCVTDSIQACTRKRERIALPGLGSFTTSKRKARVGRNPRTGQTLNIPAKTVPKFSPAKELIEAAR